MGIADNGYPFLLGYNIVKITNYKSGSIRLDYKCKYIKNLGITKIVYTKDDKGREWTLFLNSQEGFREITNSKDIMVYSPYDMELCQLKILNVKIVAPWESGTTERKVHFEIALTDIG